MHLPNYEKLQPWDVLKFVVGSDEDVAHMVAFLQTLTANPQIYIGAVHGQYDLKKLVATILETPELKDAKLQLQMHKVIWDAEERGV
jgi:7-carboxy-7-deazaguanine synthase